MIMDASQQSGLTHQQAGSFAQQPGGTANQPGQLPAPGSLPQMPDAVVNYENKSLRPSALCSTLSSH